MTARRRTASVSLAVGLIGASVLVAGPAVADEYEISTAGWNWEQVSDTTLGIVEATAFHRDVLGTGTDLLGWTTDAFDAVAHGFLDDVGFEHTNPALTMYLDPSALSSTLTPGNGGRVESRVQGHDLGGGVMLDAHFELEIRGSFARWTITVDDSGSGLVESVFGGGELGSHSVGTNVGADGLVVVDPDGEDPVIGFHLASDGVSDEVSLDAPEAVSFTATGATTLVFTLALLDYDPCAAADAEAAMIDLVPDFPSLFGEDLPPVLSECVTVEQPPAMTVGTPVDEILDLAFSGALAGGHPRLLNDSYPEHIGYATSGLAVLENDLPAGLSLEVVGTPDAPALRLHGMPIAAMAGEVPIRLYGLRASPDYSGEMPVAAVLRVDVDGLDITNPDPDGGGGGGGGELPPTGPGDAVPGLLAGGTALVLGVLLRVATGVRRGARVRDGR